MFVLLAHFRTEPGEDPLPEARPALELLAAQPDCLHLRYARSTENAGRSVLIAEFASAGAYRRAMSPFEVRTRVVPWLLTAEVGHSQVYEVSLYADEGAVRTPQTTVP